MSLREKLNKPVVCADGFRMSVQAHHSAYCTPRQDDAERYTYVEVGFPSAEEPLIMEYAEEADKPTRTVYGWVPAHVVSMVIAKHGGMVEGEVPNGVPRLMANE